MGGTKDALAVKKLNVLLKTLPPDLIEQVLGHARAVPADWRRMSVADIVRRLRHRFDMTQRQLAALSGLPHSMIARIESGQNIRLSTLYQLFAGFGCNLVLLPLSRFSAEELWRRTHYLGDDGFMPRRRRYPRR